MITLSKLKQAMALDQAFEKDIARTSLLALNVIESIIICKAILPGPIEIQLQTIEDRICAKGRLDISVTNEILDVLKKSGYSALLDPHKRVLTIQLL